jgi:DNA polymerase sigma
VLEVISEISALGDGYGFAQALSVQPVTFEWTEEAMQEIQRLWERHAPQWIPDQPFEKLMKVVLRRASLSEGSARFCAHLLLWTIERKDVDRPQLSALYEAWIDGLKQEVHRRDNLTELHNIEAIRNYAVFSKILLSYAKALADDAQAFHRNARNNPSFHLPDGGLLSASVWRKQYSAWVSQCLQIVQLLVKDYVSVPLQEGDKGPLPALDAFLVPLSGLFPETAKQSEELGKLGVKSKNAVLNGHSSENGINGHAKMGEAIVCPLSREPFIEPVIVLPSGYSCEASWLKVWEQLNVHLPDDQYWASWAVSPAYRALSEARRLGRGIETVPNSLLMELIEEHRAVGGLLCTPDGQVANKLLEGFRCPLTKEIMTDPVLVIAAGTCTTYESGHHLADHFGDQDFQTVPNLAVREFILRAFLETKSDFASNPILYDEIEAWRLKVKQKYDVKHQKQNLAVEGVYVSSGEKERPPSREDLAELDRLIDEYAEQGRGSQAAHKQTVDELLACLNTVCGEDEKLLEVKFEPFGSFMNGFGDTEANVDVAVTGNDPEEEKLRTLERVSTVLTNAKDPEDSAQKDPRIESVTAVLAARVPVCKFVFQKKLPSGVFEPVDVDICGENYLAVTNTKLLHAYANLDSRVAALGRVIKAWAKRSRIVGTQDGMLSSYAYIILVIAYLQKCESPVVPNLQAAGSEPGEELEPSIFKDGNRSYNVAFRTGESWKSANDGTTAELLYGFFAYYGRDFNWSSQVVSIRRGVYPKATDEPRGKWVIEDPFEHWRNLAGQCTESGKCQILSAFRHGQAMVRAERLPNLHVLSLPRSGIERHFLRIPVTQQDTMNSEQFGIWLLHNLYQHMDRNAPRCLVQCMRERPFQRDMFIEFPNREARSTGLAFAQRAAQGAYNFFCVGGDCFMAALGDAQAVYTKMAN